MSHDRTHFRGKTAGKRIRRKGARRLTKKQRRARRGSHVSKYPKGG